MDLSHAVRKFEEYLDHYDRDDDKIRLKITHTYGVVEYSRKIALRLGLPEEDVELAQIIGLLHDIGPVSYTHLDVYKRQGYLPSG